MNDVDVIARHRAEMFRDMAVSRMSVRTE